MEKIISGIKFTPSQQKLINRFKRGDKLCLVNAHYMNGGELRWKCEGSDYLDYAGRVYRAYCNLLWKIKKAKGEKAYKKFNDYVRISNSRSAVEYVPFN